MSETFFNVNKGRLIRQTREENIIIKRILFRSILLRSLLSDVIVFKRFICPSSFVERRVYLIFFNDRAHFVSFYFLFQVFLHKTAHIRAVCGEEQHLIVVIVNA